MTGIAVLGIDPGKNTGLGFVKNGVVLNLMSVDFWCAIDEINLFVINNENYHIVIELPKTDHVWQSKSKRGGNYSNSIAVDVGRVICQAELFVEYCTKYGINYSTKHPQGKIDAKTFNRVSGWNKSSNQHTRDAALLAFNFRNTGDL